MKRRAIAQAFIVCAMIAAMTAIAAPPSPAGLIGGDLYISGVGGMFTDVAYNSAGDDYLIVWGDYSLTPMGVSGRLVSCDGAIIGSQSRISETSAYALMPSVAYNSTDNEYLVVWIDERGGDVVYGRRVSAAGAPVGASFQISVDVQSLCAVAWSSTSNCYYVVYYGGGNTEIHGRRVSIAGGVPTLGAELNISDNPGYSGYPEVCYGSTGNQFLVSWEQEDTPDVPRIVGQRVSASSDALLGGAIDLTPAGGRSRACVAYDTVSSRWLVQFNDGTHPGNSVDQYGQLADTNGGLVGSNFPIAATPDMEGDSLRHSAVSFAPTAQRFISGFHRGIDIVGQEVGLGGALIGDPVYVTSYSSGTEAMGCSNAVDFERSRCLFVWYNLEGAVYYVHARLYELNPDPPPGPVIDFLASSGNQQNNLTWQNPVESDFTGTMIRFRTDAYPTSTSDGTLVVDKSGSPGADDSYLHTGRTNGVTYYYTAFAHDSTGPNYSLPRHSSGTPTAPTCFQDSFSYSNGALNGNGGWSGSAGSSQIAIDNQTVRILAGSGSYDAIHTANCGDPGQGYMWVNVKIHSGSGSATMWNLYIDDLANNNMARWYGSGTTARGRIGGTASVTATQTLTGGWDDLIVKINPYNNTSEFFFNGASIGTLDHGQTGAGDVIGRLRFERAESGSSPTDYLSFDSLIIGTPPTAGPCYQETFSYSDGNLNGQGGWTGSAGSQISVVGESVKITGGLTAYDAVHTTSCGDPGQGYMWVHVKCKSGSGSASNIWNLWIDDPSGANLARWYGKGTTARGRIGGTASVTAEQTLTGGWDDLGVKINPGANSSEFFFNGGSIGTLDHGQTGAGDVIGRLRFERISADCPSDYVNFDNIVIGDYDSTPPGPVTDFIATSGDSQISLSWTNPGDADFAGTMIRYKTTSFPTGPTDGTQVYNGTGTSTNHGGLTNGTVYYYSAYAYDGAPNYSSAAQASATPADVTAPGNVTSFTATSGDTQNSLSWTNPGDADFAGVKIMFKTTGYPTGPTDGTQCYNGSGTSTTHTGLTNGTTYYYTAFAFDGVPNYSSGTTASAAPADVTPPDNVTGFTATPGDTQVSLSWTNPGGDFTGTKILFKTTGYPTGPTDGTSIYDAAGTSTTHTGLTNGVTYYYKAFAHDEVPNYASGAQASATPVSSYCFRDQFAYADGALNGNGGWTGNATSAHIAMLSQTVKILGGSGAKDALKTVSCGDGGLGYIWVRTKIQKGTGSKTIWSLYINDSSGANLARWYGTGTTARGRIGGTADVTPVQTLTGAWDNIDVKIYPATNNSEFFFNGNSIGTLSHSSQGAGDTVGQLRFERANSGGASGQYIFLDDLTVGGS